MTFPTVANVGLSKGEQETIEEYRLAIRDPAGYSKEELVTLRKAAWSCVGAALVRERAPIGLSYFMTRLAACLAGQGVQPSMNAIGGLLSPKSPTQLDIDLQLHSLKKEFQIPE